MRPIDGDALCEKMYQEAFEKDTDDQRWDSGCWIRYRMFEKAIKSMPTLSIPNAEIIRCKDCQHHSGSYCHHKDSYGIYVSDNHYCGWGERRE